MFKFPSLVFFFNDGKLIAYDFAGQDYYEVDQKAYDQLQLMSLDDNHQNSLPKQSNDLPIENVYSSLKWGGDVPSYMAHQASRIWTTHTDKLSEETFVTQYCEMSAKVEGIPVRDINPDWPIVALPQPTLQNLDQLPFSKILQNRKTCREFIKQPIEIDQLSQILYACFSDIHDQKDELSELGLKNFGMRRSSPSATGLASCDALIWVESVNGLDQGLYTYNADLHQLHLHPQLITPDELSFAMLDQFWCKELSAGIFIVNDLRRTWIKDIQARGYLASHQEAGHISQTVLLCAAAIDLKTWISGTFRDDFLSEKLELADYRFVSLFIGLGHGTGKAISQKYLNLMK